VHAWGWNWGSVGGGTLPSRAPTPRWNSRPAKPARRGGRGSKSITRRAKQGREAGGDCGDSPAEEEEGEGTGPIRPTPGGGSPPAPESAATGEGGRG
jgi:hypothetical protein